MLVFLPSLVLYENYYYIPLLRNSTVWRSSQALVLMTSGPLHTGFLPLLNVIFPHCLRFFDGRHSPVTVEVLRLVQVYHKAG